MTMNANVFLTFLDKDGYLLDPNTWSEPFSEALAARDSLSLSTDHWDVIVTLRKFYIEYQLHPSLRVLIKKLQPLWGTEKANSLYLHQLFPKGPIKQASKIAGLPKPLKCL